MLKQRVITALILLPLAIWGTLALPSTVFAIVMGVIIMLGAWEWTRISGIEPIPARAIYTGMLGFLLYMLHTHFSMQGLAQVTSIIAMSWWLLALVFVLLYPRASGFWQGIASRSIIGALILITAWTCVLALRELHGPAYLLLVMVLVWTADTGAYFAGKRFGKHKLAPRVSPGKTLEGVAGALLTSGLAAAIAHVWLGVDYALVLFLGLCVLVVLISILGDLVESMFKRISGVKDSGGILPGHGGVLDRIDSLTSAAPGFVAGLWLLESVT